MGDVERVVEALCAIRGPASSEARLHERVTAALAVAGIDHEHEVDLGEPGRIDFIALDNIGIEVKIDGPRNQVLRQLHGYARAKRVMALVLLTTRATHAFGVGEILGKRLEIVKVIGWL